MEYCCFRTLALSTQVTGHLADKKFRRLTYDVMLAWEVPAASSQPLLNVSHNYYIVANNSQEIFQQLTIV